MGEFPMNGFKGDKVCSKTKRTRKLRENLQRNPSNSTGAELAALKEEGRRGKCVSRGL